MTHEQMLTRLDRAEKLVTLYLNKNKEPRSVNRAKKFLRQPLKYIYHLGYKTGLVRNEDVRVRTFWGADFLATLRDENAVAVYFCGALGRAECRLTRFLIKTLQPTDTFYDVGANYGFYTSLAASLVTEGEVHAFEPSPRTMRYVRANAPEREAAARIVLNEVALSSEEGTTTFFDTSVDHKSGMSTIVAAAAEHNPLKYREITVRTATLDSYVQSQSHTPPTVIKLDVEGAESLVLAGARRVLGMASPVIAMEVWDAPHIISRTECAIAELSDAGYRPYAILADGSVAETRLALGSLGEFNIFVFKKNAVR
jgi:FkbM family methyltransferase